MYFCLFVYFYSLIFFFSSNHFSVRSKHSQWSNYELPAIKIVLAPSSVEKYESCTLSASTSLLEPFSGLRGFNMSQNKNMAIYTIYQRTSGGSDIGKIEWNIYPKCSKMWKKSAIFREFCLPQKSTFLIGFFFVCKWTGP